MAARVRVEQQLVVVEAMTGIRLVGAVNAITVDRAGPDVGHIAVPHFVGIFGELDAGALGLAGLVEQANFDFRRVRGKQPEIDAFPTPGRTQGMGQALFQIADRRALFFSH